MKSTTSFRNNIPLILSITFIIVLFILSFFKIKLLLQLQSPLLLLFAAFIISYLVWLVLEFNTAKSETTKGQKTNDFGTCEIYALGRALTLLSGIGFYSQWSKISIIHILGYSIFVFGFSFRVYSIRTLGKYYSHIVRKVDGHRIISTGPYRLMRHPAYTGMILANLGVTLFFFNYITLAIYAGILIPSIIVRIIVEEKTLFTIEGYETYAKNRKRIIPFIW